MTEFILEPLDGEDEVEISLGDIDLGDGFSLEAVDEPSRQRRSAGGSIGGSFAPSDDGFTAFMNRGILSGLTGPMEFLDRNINQRLDRFLGVGGPDELTQGPRGLATDLFSRAGGAVADEGAVARDSGLGAEVGDFLGDVLGLLPATGAAIGAVPTRVATSPTATQGGTRIAQEAVNMMQRGITQSPRLAAAAEVGAGIGGGLGGVAARETFGEEYETAGQLTGAFALPAAPAAATATLLGAARAAKPVPIVGEALDRMAGTFSGDTFARRKARETLMSEAEDFETAIGRLRMSQDPYAQDGGLDLAPLGRTGDQGLLTLQSRLAANDPNTRRLLREREADNMTAARELASTNQDGQTGNVPAARAAASEHLTEQRQLIDQRINDAVDAATQAVERAGPRTTESRSEASRIVATSLREAREETRETVRDAWRSVPQTDRVRLNSMSAAYDDVVSMAGQAKSDSIPSLARQYLDPNSGSFYGDTQDGAEIFRFYSQMRENADIAAKAGKYTEAGFANRLADAALKDIQAHEPTSELYKVARDASRTFHEKFTRGPVGDLLNPAGRGGDPRVTEYAALDRLLGARGGQERANLEALEAALGPYNPAPYRAAEDYVRSSFTDAISPASSVAMNPNAGARYLQAHQELFTKYPQMRSLFEETIDTVNHVAVARAHGKQQSTALDQSIAQRFSNSAVDKEFAAILKTPDPATELRQLRDVLSAQDPSGVAVEGLRQTGRNHLVNNMLDFDATRGQVLRATSYEKLMRSNRGVFEELLGPQEMAKLDALSAQLKTLEVAGGMSPQRGTIVPPSILVQALSRYTSLKFGSRFISGGPTALTQSSALSRFVSSLSDRMTSGGAERLLQEAARPGNEAILLDLMTAPQNAAQADRLVRSLDAWLSTLPVTMSSDVQEADSDGDFDALFEGLGVSR